MKLSKLLPAYFLTFVNALGFSILTPVLPFVIKQYEAPEYVYGALLSFYAFFQFIGSPILGSLSDRVGRKPVLIISQIGTMLCWVIFGVAYFLPDVQVLWFALPLWVIAFARIMDGITGGNISVTNAYISDITTNKQKATIFGYLGGISGIAFIIGPGVGGYASSGGWGYFGAILVAFFISLITVLLLIFYVDESLPKDKRREKQKFSLLKTLAIPVRIKALNPIPFVKQLFFIRLLVGIAMSSYIGTIALYVIDLYNFDESEMGLFMLFVGGFMSFNQAFLYKRVVKLVGEVKTLIIGLTLMSTGYFLITLSVSLPVYLCLYYVLNLGFSLSFPVFNSLISQKANPQKQGEAMGISESINSLCNAIFPVLAAFLYSQMGYKFYYLIIFIPVLAVFASYQLLTKAKFVEDKKLKEYHREQRVHP